MFTKLMILTASLVLFINSSAYADLAIIGHPDADTGALDIQKIRKLFLGERKSFPNGIHATPINHVVGSPDRKEFFSSVLGIPESSYSRHWKRKVAVGAGTSPAELASHNEVLHTIANTPGSIGYIDADRVDETVKVLLTVSDFENI